MNSIYLDFWEPLKEKIFAHLNRYLVADEVEIHDPNDQWTMLSLQGPRAQMHTRPNSLPMPNCPAQPDQHGWCNSTARRCASCAPIAAGTMALI